MKLDRLRPKDWKSLQLVHAVGVEFRPEAQRPGWRVRFNDARRCPYTLRLTDPCLLGRLQRKDRIGSNCLLAISLAEPWEPEDHSTPSMCFKLVAGVLEL